MKPLGVNGASVTSRSEQVYLVVMNDFARYLFTVL